MPRPRFSALCWVVLLYVALGVSRVTAAEPTTPTDGHLFYLPVVFAHSPYVLQPGSPVYLANFLNASGCNWFGFGGRAFGQDSNPVFGLIVHLDGGGLNVDVLTGTGPSALGPASYEIQISDHPIASTGVYVIQLRDNFGIPLSPSYMIPTYADCTKNLVMINFIATP